MISAMKSLIRQYSVLSYYVLTFTVSWGGFLIVGGPGLLAGTDWKSDPQFQIAVVSMLAGPPIAGILSTILVSGSAGVRELGTRLFRWRVGAHWYAVALVIAPLVQVSVLFALSVFSPEYLPALVTAEDKTSLLLLGLTVGLVGGFVEELGWTGFAIPRLRSRHSFFTTGFIVGVLWGAWHLLQMFWVGSTSSGTVAPAVFLPLYFLSAIVTLTAYRVLMVWVYEHTESLFLAILMHASYIFTTLFVFAPPIIGLPFLIYSGVFAAILWGTVVFLTMTGRSDR